jgi:hypothetical protein
MARSIVLPLYAHTSDEEIAEILSELRRIGLDGAQVVNAYAIVCERETYCALEHGHEGSCRGVGHVLAAIDQDGDRLDVPERPDPEEATPVLSMELARELRRVRDELSPLPVGVDRYSVERPERFRDHAEEIAHVRSLELLRVASVAISGRDGWRRTPDGREWYSAEWLGAIV